MSDVPFGFSPQDPDDRDKGDSSEGRSDGGAAGSGNSSGSGGNSGFGGMPNFDVGALGQMLTQLGQALSHSGGGNEGPVNYDLAKQLAVQQLHSNERTERPSQEQVKAVEDAVHAALRPGGRFCFSVEAGEGTDYVLRPSNRYAHTLEYMQRLAAASGFTVLATQALDAREENGAPIAAHALVLC